MLDLNQADTSATGQLNRLVFKRKGDDDGGLQWDLDVAFPIASPETLLAADSVVPGAARLIEQAEASGKRYTLVDKTERPDAKLTIVGSEDEAALVDGVTAEVRFTRLVISGRVAAATVRLRIGGTAQQRTDLIANLGEDVTVRLEAQQQAIPFALGRKVNSGEIVTLASGHAGVAQSVSDAEVTVMDLDGVARTAKIGDVRASMKVCGPDEGGIGGQITNYKRRCARKGLVASWRDLTTAIGQAYANGKAPTAYGYVVDGDVLDIAIKLADHVPGDVPQSADGMAVS